MICTRPKIAPTTGGLYEVLEDLRVEYTHNGEEKICTIPSGFLTDGASIPRVLWTFIGSPFQPIFIQAAIVHDYMFRGGYDIDEASDVFYDLLIQNGVGSTLARGMALTVRIFSYVVL